MLKESISKFRPISLEQMSGVKLMNRTDTKFVTDISHLEQLLQLAGTDYYVQEIDGQRNMAYRTLYFDTSDFSMYRVHQYGQANRQKVRFRSYVANHLQFLEVKTKNNHGRTKKKRIEVSDTCICDETKKAFLAAHLRYDTDSLIPALSNQFNRITLVNKAMTERLTIDSDLFFHNEQSQKELSMGPLVIIELKRDGLCPSPVLDMLRQLRIHPHGFSKYCMGSALTNNRLPVNLFKPKLGYVNKLLDYKLY